MEQQGPHDQHVAGGGFAEVCLLRLSPLPGFGRIQAAQAVAARQDHQSAGLGTRRVQVEAQREHLLQHGNRRLDMIDSRFFPTRGHSLEPEPCASRRP
jgi:transposase